MKYISAILGVIVFGIITQGTNAYAQNGFPTAKKVMLVSEEQQEQLEALREERQALFNATQEQRIQLVGEKKAYGTETKDLLDQATSVQAKKGILEEASEHREAVKGEAQKLRENFKEEMQSMTVARRLFAIQRYQAVFTRIESISTRIQERANLVETTGVDTSKVEELINQSKEQLSLAESALDTLVESFESETDEEYLQAVKEIHTTLTKIKEYLHQAWDYNKEALQTLKDIATQ